MKPVAYSPGVPAAGRTARRLLSRVLGFAVVLTLCLIMLGAWLLRYDITRYTIKKTGLTRYIAACLLPGYVWLIVGGVLFGICGVLLAR